MFYWVLFFYFLVSVSAIDESQLEVFDVVEEVNQNFYALLGISQDASTSEVRKAYRKLSLTLHPDKNTSPDAEVQFRQLVSVYEVLKDSKKRKHYDNVLEFGMPDWRQPIYYYRKARKLGMLEISILLAVILTIGHFLVIWASYFEKRFEIEEVITSRLKKLGKNRKKQLGDDEIHSVINEELKSLERPNFYHVLPISLSKRFIQLLISLPQQLSMFYQEAKLKMYPPEICTEEPQSNYKPKRVVLQPDIVPEMCNDLAPVSTTKHVQNSNSDIQQGSTQKSNDSEWSKDEISQLFKLVTKIPGGTPKRWEKIAEALNRSVSDVTSQAKQLKVSIGATSNWESSQNEVYGLEPEKSLEWSQEQQKCFEWALKNVTKDETDRWTAIANYVPDKTF